LSPCLSAKDKIVRPIQNRSQQYGTAVDALTPKRSRTMIGSSCAVGDCHTYHRAIGLEVTNTSGRQRRPRNMTAVLSFIGGY